MILLFRTSLARAHAQLRLVTDVQAEDAVMAILLYEESATYRYGWWYISLVNNQILTIIPCKRYRTESPLPEIVIQSTGIVNHRVISTGNFININLGLAFGSQHRSP